MEFLLVLTMNMFGHLLVVVYAMRMLIVIILISLYLLEMIAHVTSLIICGGISSSVVQIHLGSSKCCLQQLLTKLCEFVEIKRIVMRILH